jgi:hypothetical protein
MDDLITGRRYPLASIIISAVSWGVIIGTGWFLFVNPGRLRTILFPPKPCSAQIRYSIGSIDPRFNVSTSTLREDIDAAAASWNTAVGKMVFAYDPKGPLRVSLVYDERQAAADEIKKLGYSISDDRASFDALKAKYDSEKAAYTPKKAAFDALTKTFNADMAAYNAKVKSINERGGATPDVLKDLKREQADVDAEAARVRASQADLNALVDQLNAMGKVLKRQANALNQKIDQTNNVSDSLGQEYEEGLYTSDQNGTAITVYTFSSPKDLLGVLTHEFGHALGLDHLNDPNAVMYRLNNGHQDHLAQADINAARGLCRVKN